MKRGLLLLLACALTAWGSDPTQSAEQEPQRKVATLLESLEELSAAEESEAIEVIDEPAVPFTFTIKCVGSEPLHDKTLHDLGITNLVLLLDVPAPVPEPSETETHSSSGKLVVVASLCALTSLIVLAGIGVVCVRRVRP